MKINDNKWVKMLKVYDPPLKEYVLYIQLNVDNY